MKEKELKEVLNLAQAELRAMYKRLGINGSNVLDQVDDAYNSLNWRDASPSPSDHIGEENLAVPLLEWISKNGVYEPIDEGWVDGNSNMDEPTIVSSEQLFEKYKKSAEYKALNIGDKQAIPFEQFYEWINKEERSELEIFQWFKSPSQPLPATKEIDLEAMALEIRKRVLHYRDDIIQFKKWFSEFRARPEFQQGFTEADMIKCWQDGHSKGTAGQYGFQVLFSNFLQSLTPNPAPGGGKSNDKKIH